LVKSVKLAMVGLVAAILLACPPVSPASHTAVLTWQDTVSGPDFVFHIYRSTNGVNFFVVATVTKLTWVDINVQPNHVYWYYATQYQNSTGKESAKSNIVKAVVKP